MQSDRGSRLPWLGKRERWVLHLMRRGFTDQRIAGRFGIKPSTVRSYVARLKQKFGVANRAQLGQAAARYEQAAGPLVSPSEGDSQP
jgi:DNA-binding NarL/FixJ family response regulator